MTDGRRTTDYVAGALAGDRESLERMVERITPLLMLQARRHLPRTLVRLYDPEEVVQEVWTRAFPRLVEFQSRGARKTPSLVRYLATILQRYVIDLKRKELHKVELESAAEKELPEETRTIVTRACRLEREGMVQRVLDALDERERDLLVLRGLEDTPYAEIAAIQGDSEGSLRLAYHRLVHRLREVFPRELADELAAE